MNLLSLLSFFILISVCSSPNSNVKNESCEAKIEYTIDEGEEMITIQAKATNNASSNTSFKYKLEVEKNGPSGTSSNSQSGEIEAEAGATVNLSTQSLDYRKGNEYKITLSVASSEGVKCRASKRLKYEE